jgi:hypothetical protein
VYCEGAGVAILASGYPREVGIRSLMGVRRPCLCTFIHPLRDAEALLLFRLGKF